MSTVLDVVAYAVLGYYVGRGLGYILFNVLTFIRYRRRDGQNHPSIRQ